MLPNIRFFVQFFSCLLIVLVAEIAAGAWAYHNSAKLDSYVRSAVKEAVQDEYSVVATRTTTMDSIQKYVSIRLCFFFLYNR